MTSRARDEARAALAAFDRAGVETVLTKVPAVVAALRVLLDETAPSPDEPGFLTLDELGDAMSRASDRWDGEDAMEAIVLRFIEHYSDLDRAIDAARREHDYDDDAPIWFRWDADRGELVIHHQGPMTVAMVDAAARAMHARTNALSVSGARDLFQIGLEAAEAAR